MSKLKTGQAGFSAVAIVGVLLVLVAIAGVGFLVFKKSAGTKTAITNPTSSPPAVQPARPAPAEQYPGMKLYSNQKYGFSFTTRRNGRLVNHSQHHSQKAPRRWNSA
jgi:hypothetical protein